MNQPFLFELPEIDLKQLLINSRNEEGRVFYSVKEVAKLLTLSEFQVYWAIWLYRLDAFLLAGEWRISFLAILDYQQNADSIQEQYFAYAEAIKEREIPFIRKVREVVKTGGTVEEAYNLYHKKGVLISRDLVKRIVYKVLPNIRSYGTKEEDLLDWYSIPDLKLPLEAPVHFWADLFKVSSESLKKDLGTSKSILKHPDIYEYLVDREMVNIGCFENNKSAITEVKEEAQMNLF